MPWILDYHPVMDSMRIRDTRSLPKHLYRVQWDGCKTSDVHPDGLAASNQRIDITDAEFNRYVGHQFTSREETDEGQPTVFRLEDGQQRPRARHPNRPFDVETTESLRSPLIALFGDERDAKLWARKQSRRTGSNCRVLELDSFELLRSGGRGDSSTKLWRFDIELVDALGVYVHPVPECKWLMGGHGCQERQYAYLAFHAVPERAITREFWWGEHAIPSVFDGALQLEAVNADGSLIRTADVIEVPVERSRRR